MVMVLLLMSQWSVNKSVEAADAADNDVEWMDSSAAVVTHYAPGSTTSNAVFYINDADLGVTQSGTSTWTLATSGSPNGAVASAALNLQNGTIGTTAINTSNMRLSTGYVKFSHCIICIITCYRTYCWAFPTLAYS